MHFPDLSNDRNMVLYYIVSFIVILIFGVASINGFTFFLDTPTIISTANNGPIWQSLNSALEDGRYMPVFGLCNYIGWHLSGGNIAGIQAVQVAILGTIMFVIGSLFKTCNVSSLFVLAAAGMITIVRPAAEVIMTVAKAEGIVTLLILSALLIMCCDPVLRGHKYGKTVSIIYPFLYGISTLGAILSKETAAVLLISSPASAIYAFIAPSGEKMRRYKRTVIYTLVTIIGIAVARAPMIIAGHKALDRPTYAAFKPTILSIKTNLYYYYTQCSDIIWIILGISILLFYCFISSKKREPYNPNLQVVATATIIWVTATVYFIGMQLWRWGFVYYMYPVYILCGISFLLCLQILITGSRIDKIVSIFLISFFLLSKTYDVVTFISNATAQRMTSECYSDFMKEVQQRSNLHPNAHIYMCDYSQISEPPIQTNVMLRMLGIKNITAVGALELIVPNTNHQNESLFKINTVEKENLTPKSGDLIIQFSRCYPLKGEIRAVTNPNKLNIVNLKEALGLKTKVLISQNKSVVVPAVYSLNNGFNMVVLQSGFQLSEVE